LQLRNLIKMQSDMSMIIRIASIIGDTCITVEDGKRVYDIIHPELVKGQEATLDFTGVKIFASPFFNTAIGQLLSDIKNQQLQSQLKIVGLSQNGTHIMTRVIENAKRYYTNAHFRDSVDKVLSQQAQDL
jgi:hypothetical protein